MLDTSTESITAPHPARTTILLLSVLWAAGACLRLTMLAVPPVLPAIHHDLHLSETAVGALTALPVLLLAAIAVPGSFVISRLGARRALISGLLLLGITGAARGVGLSTPVLFTMTFLMGVGVAISQPALPTLVKQWFGGRIARATAAYSNGLLVGEILPVVVSAPFILPLVAHAWPPDLAFWSLPVLLTAGAIVFLTPHVPPAPNEPRSAWWPNWGDGTIWRLGLTVGCASAAYFAANAFIPDYLKATHAGSLITPALSSLNLSQFPASFLLAAFPNTMIGRRWPLITAGVSVACSAAAFLLGGVWVVVFSASLGLSTATVFVLGISLPPMLAPAHDVPRLSSAVFTIMYACAFVGSVIAGALWDTTGLGTAAFAPIFLSGVLLAILGSTLRVRHTEHTL